MGKLIDIDYRTVLAVGGVALVIYYVLTRDAKAAAGATYDAAAAAAQKVNPLNPQNVAATGVNAVGRSIGDTQWERDHWTLGGSLFDLLNGTNTTDGDFSTSNPYVKR